MRPDESAPGVGGDVPTTGLPNLGPPDDVFPVFDAGGHLDEGAAHAFVDGALPDEDAARVVLHLAGCARCSALVAAARGLTAAAAGVLRRLDDGPGAVRVADVVAPLGGSAGGSDVERAARTRATRRWWAGPQARAAAAVLLAAGVGGSVYLSSRTPQGASRVAAAPAVDSVAPAAPAAPAAATAGAAFASPPPSPLAEARPPAASQAATPTSAPPTPAPAGAPAVAARPAPSDAAAGAVGSTNRAAAAPQVAGRAERATGATRVDSVVVADATSMAAPAPPPRASALPPLATAGAQAKAAAPMTAAAGRADVGAVGVVRGEVRDAQGRALAGADVFVAGTSAHATTDAAGRFVLPQVPAGQATLRARHVGFGQETTVVAVTPADTARATLRLGASALTLSQVVVSGADSAPATAGREAEPRMARMDRRVRRTGMQQAIPALGCFTVVTAGGSAGASARALPSPVTLGTNGAVTVGGAVRGAWGRIGSDSLSVTWDDGSAPLALRRERAGWAGAGYRLVPATGVGCGGP